MAYRCKYDNKECIGCMMCKESKPIMYDCFNSEIYEGDVYYEIDDEIIYEENIEEWLKEYKKIASSD